jgi:two-component system chemotaxis response regulator CheY
MNPMDFLDEFQAEAIEKLDIINSQLLRLERDSSDPQPVREMFLAAHTVKGGAAMLRLTAVEVLAHALEDLLSSFRDEERALDPGIADLLFQTIDQLRSFVLAASADAVGADLDPATEEFVAKLRLSASQTVAPTAPKSGGRALLVDDSATVRELHAFLLREAGFDVEAVDHGDVALARAHQETFEVVVSGLRLRGLSGFELAAALRLMPGYAEVPIILMSADADAERAREATAAGATALTRKAALEDEQLTAALRQPRSRAA